MSIDSIFTAGSVCIIGVSREEGKIGNTILANLKKGFKGEIFIVHPATDRIQGVRCYKDIESLPISPDIAIVALPSSKVASSLEALGKKGCKVCIPIAGGFGESGEEGKILERDLIAIARKYKIRVLGPNTVGLLIPNTGLNTALTTDEKTSFPASGPVGFISQSGALGLLTMDEFSNLNLGFSAFISLGNEIDIDETDALIGLGSNQSTRSIALYLEKIKRPEDFLKEASRVSKEKGIVVLKGGQSESGSRATSLHTGSLFRTNFSLKGIFRQHGIIQAVNEVELIDFSMALSYGKQIEGSRVAIVTSAGGVGVTSSDILESNGFNVKRIEGELEESIKADISPIGSASNPIDMTSEATNKQYQSVVMKLNASQEFDSILVFVLFQTYGVTEEIVHFLSEFNRGDNIPIVAGVIGGKYSDEGLKKLIGAGIPAFPSISRSVKALRILRERGEYLRRYRDVNNA